MLAGIYYLHFDFFISFMLFPTIKGVIHLGVKSTRDKRYASIEGAIFHTSLTLTSFFLAWQHSG